jgi:hypothetical protein
LTESQWLACADPDIMLEFLQSKVAERKIALFAAACGRRIWHLFTDPRSRPAIEAAEQAADGLMSKEEHRAAMNAAHDAFMELKGEGEFDPTAAYARTARIHFAAYSAGGGHFSDVAARDVAECLADSLAERETPRWRGAYQSERRAQCHVLRDIIGSPFASLTEEEEWSPSAEVVSLARRIRDKRDFAVLPQLAELAQMSGAAGELIAHLERPGEHARGCWALDQILGNQRQIHSGPITHAGWATCSDPEILLGFVGNRASDRKWRLYLVGCCRRILHLIPEGPCRMGLEVAARFANGLATRGELEAARAAVDQAEHDAHYASYCAEADSNFCYTAKYCAIDATHFAVLAVQSALLLPGEEPAARIQQRLVGGTYAEPLRERPYACNVQAHRSHRTRLLRHVRRIIRTR